MHPDVYNVKDKNFAHLSLSLSLSQKLQIDFVDF